MQFAPYWMNLLPSRSTILTADTAEVPLLPPTSITKEGLTT